MSSDIAYRGRHKILNPKTGRYVYKTGSIGKSISKGKKSTAKKVPKTTVKKAPKTTVQKTKKTTIKKVNKSPSKKTIRKTRPRLTEIRRHKSRPYKYIWEFHPDTERHAWLRYDTFRNGTWRNNPYKTANQKDLV